MSDAPATIPLEEGIAMARTGDIWTFRGRSVVNKVMHAATNSPVNHVGMALVLDDLPPLLWHAELGRSSLDLWSATHHRGAQVHDLRESVCRWQEKYAQRAFLRQLHPTVTRPLEDRALLSIERLDGVAFPSTVRLAGKWLRGRDGYLSPREITRGRGRPSAAYCAEIVGTTLQDIGILRIDAPSNWFDPGRFWSGDTLPLADGWSYGTEIEVARAVSGGTRWERQDDGDADGVPDCSKTE